MKADLSLHSAGNQKKEINTKKVLYFAKGKKDKDTLYSYRYKHISRSSSKQNEQPSSSGQQEARRRWLSVEPGVLLETKMTDTKHSYAIND